MKREKNKQITTKKPKNGLNIEELFFQLEDDSCDYENNAITLLPIRENLENICKYICELYDNTVSKEKRKEAADYFREMIKNGYYNADKSLLRSKKGIETIFKDVLKYLKDLINKKNIVAIEQYLDILEKYTNNKSKGKLKTYFRDKLKFIRKIRSYTTLGSDICKENLKFLNCMKESKEESESNKEEKAKLCRSFADAGNILAMFYYGEMLEGGKGIKQNKEEAAKYFKMAADNGNINAILSYVLMLYEGNGIEQNIEEGEKYLKMAVDSGDAEAIYYYALLYKGFEKNKKKKVEYLKIAADKGNVYAMVDYAIMLYNGENIKVNKEEAIKYFKIAADKGNVKAIDIYTDILDEDDYDVNTLIKYIKLMKNNIINLKSVI